MKLVAKCFNIITILILDSVLLLLECISLQDNINWKILYLFDRIILVSIY